MDELKKTMDKFDEQPRTQQSKMFKKILDILSNTDPDDLKRNEIYKLIDEFKIKFKKETYYTNDIYFKTFERIFGNGLFDYGIRKPLNPNVFNNSFNKIKKYLSLCVDKIQFNENNFDKIFNHIMYTINQTFEHVPEQNRENLEPIPIMYYSNWIVDFLIFYKSFNTFNKLNLNVFCKILKSEKIMRCFEQINSPDKKYQDYNRNSNKKYHSKTFERMYLIILKNNLLDFTFDYENLDRTIVFCKKIGAKYINDFVKYLLDTQLFVQPNQTNQQKYFELATKYDIIDLYTYIKINFKPSYTDTTFAYSCVNCNEQMILDFLDMKRIPTSDDLLNICLSHNTNKQSIIEKFFEYGLEKSKVQEILLFAGVEIPNTKPTQKPIDKVIAENHKLTKITDVASKNRKKYDDIQNPDVTIDGNLQQHLRNIYLLLRLEDILYFQDTNELEPDIFCFENSLNNSDTSVVDFVVQNYSYKPSALGILKINDNQRRILYFKKYFPDMLNLDHLKIEIKPNKKISVKSNAKSKSNPTDSDDNANLNLNVTETETEFVDFSDSPVEENLTKPKKIVKPKTKTK